ncbi:MAG: mechanosensitive ion channel family protein [Flavobacteriales bacterium]|nr:mechanosensitive ion channel family protein [Flavobacteriales bacterium]
MKHSISRPSCLRMLLGALLSLTGVFAIAQGVQKATSDSLPVGKKITVPVTPYGDTLFFIATRAGDFSPQARAEAIAERILRIGAEPSYSSDSLRVDTMEGSHDVVHGDEVVVSISKQEAAAHGSSPGQLAVEYRDRIAKAVEAHHHSVKWTTWAKEIGLAVVVIVVLILMLRLVARAFRWTRSWLIEQNGKLIRGLVIRDYELFTADRSVNALLLLNNVLRWLTVLFILYIALPVLFGIFPWTQDLAATLFGYVTRPVGGILSAMWHFLPNLITIVVIFFVFHYVIKGLAFLRNEVERGALTLPGFYPDWAAPTFQLLRILFYAFMVVVIFPYLPGSDSPVFRGVTVFLGALFTFGSAGSLSNIIAGLVLTYMRSFQIGDRVKIGDVTGDVIEKTMLVTRVRTVKNEIISIPNSGVIGSHTINYTSESVGRGLIIHTTVTIGYDVPWRQVHQLLIDAAMATEMLKSEPTPFVLQTSLDDFFVSYEINAYTDQPAKQAHIYSQLHQHIQDSFNAAGVEIMSPHYRAVRDGNMTTMASDKVPDGYQAPAFRVEDITKGKP